MAPEEVTDPGYDYLRAPLGDFLERMGSREPTPGGGAAAAVAVAMAAALTAMAARFAGDRLERGPEVIARADSLRLCVAPLAEADARAYAKVLGAGALPREPHPEERRRAVRSALSSAADIPLAVAEAAAEVADLAAQVAVRGNPNLRGDATAAALLAEAAARIAATLVNINLGDNDDGRRHRADELAVAATTSALRAVDHTQSR
ncbi:MAG: cyclodeaminase/cyclohydrolase family protein [Actinobacteria bacterium]|nr:cyclodeaminase/cyclohydrolase family protein [Actinomycetota bacterium]